MPTNPTEFLQLTIRIARFFLNQSNWPTIRFVAMIICLVGSAFFAYGIVRIWRLNWPMETPIKVAKKLPPPPDPKIALRLWNGILKKAEKGTERDLAFAIIEADKLVDAILQQSGYMGETMAERMKKITRAQLATIDDLWRAHKIRNEIVHAPGYHLALDTAKSTLVDYQKVLEELEVI